MVEPPKTTSTVNSAEASDESNRKVTSELRNRSRRGFLVGAGAVFGGLAFLKWVTTQPTIGGLSAPFRWALDVNACIGRTLFRPQALAPQFNPSQAAVEFRRNGDIGLAEIEIKDWRLELVGVFHPETYHQYTPDVLSWTYGADEDEPSRSQEDSSQDPAKHEQDAKGSAITMKPMTMPPKPDGLPGLLLTIEDIRALPKAEMIAEFKCIEGWSQIVHWGGARFRDFLTAYPPVTRSGSPFSPDARPNDMPEYVGFETPDGEYYVGIEREVALHPQTLLAYEINNTPLSADHGAPLRLVTPLKYGIKQLKQIGRVTYTDTRPPDYWAERGYDYYSGH